MTKVQSQSAAVVSTAKDAEDAFAPHAAKTWLTVFPVTALGIILVQPGAQFSVLMATGLMAMLTVVAHVSVASPNSRHFNIGQMMMGLVAPVQFALMIWVAVYAGRMLAGESLAMSSLAAFAAFASLLVADALVSALMLLVSDRGRSTRGISMAAFIAGKYAGLFGRVF